MSALSRPSVFFILTPDYWAHTSVAIASVLEKADNIDLHVFSEVVNDRWFTKLTRLVQDSDSTITFHPFDASLAKGLKECGYLGLSAYYRLFIPELFVGKVDRLIYLDSDMVICSSIHELAALPLDGCAIGAVPSFSAEQNQSKALNLGHGKSSAYFNSGVLVIDPRRWQEEGVLGQCLNFARQHPERIQFADQDLLNYVLAGRYKVLPLSWNVTVELYGAVDMADLEGFTLEELEIARSNPHIVHFNGCFKPWHMNYRHPFKATYTRFRRRLQAMPYLADDVPWPYLSKPLRFLQRQFT